MTYSDGTPRSDPHEWDVKYYFGEGDSTEVFSLTPGVYSRIILKGLTSKLLWIILFPIAIFALLGAYVDVTWYYVIPITIFLIAPLLLFMAYYTSALSNEAAIALQPHSFQYDSDGINCRIYFKPDDKTEKITPDDNDEVKMTAGATTLYREEKMKLRKEIVYFHNDITEQTIEGEYEIIKLKGGSGKFLVIPLQCKKIGDNKS